MKQKIMETIKMKHLLVFFVVFVFLHIVLLDYFVLTTYSRINTLFTENEVLLHVIESVNFTEDAFGLSTLFERKLPPSYLAAIHQLYALFITQVHRVSVIENRLILDTSTNMETSIILTRIAARHQTVRRMVVDVGAMDGISGSNSFNYIVMGWDALLVEPYAPHVRSIERNLELYIKRMYQNVSVVEAVISDYDGTRMMSVSPDNSKTSSSIMPSANGKGEVVLVRSYTPKTLAKLYEIPTNFGVLTVDAEGADVLVVNQFIEDGFRPSYIILETRLLPVDQTDAFLSLHGYSRIAAVGSNVVWEHN